MSPEAEDTTVISDPTTGTPKLPDGWAKVELLDEEPPQTENLPDGWAKVELLDEEEDPQAIFKDMSLLDQTVWLGKELWRAPRDFTESAMSAATFGLSDKLNEFLLTDKMKEFLATRGLDEKRKGKSLAQKAGEFTGMMLPISKLSNVFKGPAMHMASKSPVLQKQLGSLANMFMTGVTYEGLETLFKGEMPSTEDMLEHGAEWAILDAGLQLIGGAFKFGKAMVKILGFTGKTKVDAVNKLMGQVKKSGVDMTKKERVAEKALEILEEEASRIPVEQTRVGMPKEPITTPSSRKALEILEEESSRAPVEQTRVGVTKAPVTTPSSKKALEILEEESSRAPVEQTRVGIPKEQVPEPVPESFNQGAPGPKEIPGLPNLPEVAIVGEEAAVAKAARERMAQEVITPADLKNKKIEHLPSNTFKTEVVELSEPYTKKTIDLTKEVEALAEKSVAQKVETIGPKAQSNEVLGTILRDEVQIAREIAEDEYKVLYKQVDRLATGIKHNPENLFEFAGKKLLSLESISTQPPGYATTIHHIETALNDGGYTVTRNKAGKVIKISKKESVPLSNTIELTRRLGEISNFEATEPSVKKALGEIIKSGKADIHQALIPHPDAKAAYELAEKAYGKTRDRFGRDSLRKIRYEEAGEKVAKILDSPTGVGDLRDVLTPQEMKKVERSILDRMMKSTEKEAKSTLREFSRHLSDDAKKVAEEIVASKNPHYTGRHRQLAKEGVVNEVAEAFTTGQRPSNTLNLWKTPEGKEVVKSAFRGSPNWPVVKKYLEKQSFNDVVASVMKDGHIDLKSLDNLLRQPEVLENIRAIGGEEAVSFFKKLDTRLGRINQNLKILDHLPTAEELARAKSLSKKQTYGQSKLDRFKEDVKEYKERLSKFHEYDSAYETAAAEYEAAILEEKAAKEAANKSRLPNLYKETIDDLTKRLETSSKVKGKQALKRSSSKESARKSRLPNLYRETIDDLTNALETTSGVKGSQALKRSAANEAARKSRLPNLFKKTTDDLIEYKKTTPTERGSQILKKAAESTFPNQAKVKKWGEIFKETMGFSLKGSLSVLTAMKLGVPQAGAVMVGYKLMSKMLTNPRVRKAFVEASKHYTDPLKFIMAMEAFEKTLEEDEEEQPLEGGF